MKNKKIILSIIIALLIISSIGFANGYRFSGFSITKVPIINISVPFSGSTIIVDNKEYKTTKEDSQTVTIKQSKQGTRNIIVAHPDRWPWTKNISVENRQVYNLSPFNLKQSAEVELISQDNPSYTELITEIKETAKPTKENPIISFDKKIAIFMSENTVFATWNGPEKEIPEIFCNKDEEKNMSINIKECRKTIQIVNFVTNINSIGLYPNTIDRIIFSAEGSISVLEIAPSGNQNFQHILQGQNPYFTFKNGKLLVADGKALGEIILE